MKYSTLALAAALSLATGVVSAKVPQAEADKLKGELMPLGGQKAGNGSTIPDWDGGLKKAHTTGERYTNPWPEDKPKYKITKANLGEHKAMLSPGQLAIFEKYDTYTIPVYETRRSTSAPDFVYEATYQNALKAELANDGEALKNAVTGIPFPIPSKTEGKEVIWNHKTRYRGKSVTRYNNQLAVTSGGTFTVFKLKEDVKFKYNIPNQTPEDLNNILVYFLQQTLEPARQAGGLLLVHDTLDQVKEARRAWLYNPGQRRLRRAPNVAYDNPGTGADGLRVNDQLDVFNGALDRYNWKVVGKKEMVVPANSFELHSDKYKYDDVADDKHLNQDLARYEVRRVWEIDANVKDGTNHVYKRRVFYVDEDNWQIVLVDIYDGRDQLWRVQEGHVAQAYDLQAILPVAGTVYDLLATRYLIMDLNNEDPEVVEADFDDEYFSTSNVKKLAK